MNGFDEREGVGSETNRQAIARWLTDHIAELTGIDPEEVDPSAPFASFGITSVQAVGLSGELGELLETELPESLLYDHSSIESLSTALSSAGVSGKGGPAPELPAADRSIPDDDPVCVIGLSCTFPAADSAAEFWVNLLTGVDAGSGIPADRWDSALYTDPDPDSAGKCYIDRGAFVADIAGFDAEYFGISLREALRMDPQQRMLLQTCARALADAGLPADEKDRDSTGVYVGMMATSQYHNVLLDAMGDSELDDPYFGLGTAASVAAGRISYLLDLHGPSMVVDTACSSALLAVHLAVADIKQGACETAIAGGVSAILHHDAVRQACKMRMLAADGRNKTFDDAADGFLLGEGCGAVVLQRMSLARARGHRILAVIKGSAVNQDGRTNGLTAPNGQAQAAVIRRAHAQAGVTPQEICFHEAHGSGTKLGDAIEMSAITEVFGHHRGQSPLPVGAVKSGIGHLTGASGIAGLIKTILVLQHRQIPPNLHLTNPSRSIDWDRAPVVLPDRPIPLPGDAVDLVAGVSSFGWSGTNVHVIVGSAPPPPAAIDAAGWQVLTLSCKTKPALARLVRDFAEHLSGSPDLNPADIAYTTQVARSAHRHRVALAFGSVPELLSRLNGIDPRSFQEVHDAADRPVAFLLPGTGDHYPRMGAALYEREPAFRAAIHECARIADPLLGRSLTEILFPATLENPDAPASGLLAALGRGSDTAGSGEQPIEVAHACAFALDVAAVELWRTRGLQPAAVIGYSLGEYAAAWAAGILSLPDAVRLVISRARLIDNAPAGAMLTVACPAERLTPTMSAELTLAAVNGPQNCVVAGPEQAIRELQIELDSREIVHRRIPTTRAMHSRMLEPLRADLESLVSGYDLRPPQIPILSNVTGTVLTAEQATDPRYWADHLCSTVRFSDGITELSVRFGGCLVDMGAGQLGSLALQTLGAAGVRATVVPTLSTAMDPAGDAQVLATGSARLWSMGASIRWERPPGGSIVSLPSHPLRQTRFWPGDRPSAGPAATTATTALPGTRERPASRTQLLESCWQPVDADTSGSVLGPVLIFTTEDGPSARLAAAVADGIGASNELITVVAGQRFSKIAPARYSIRSDAATGDHEALIADLEQHRMLPRTIVHLWLVDGNVGGATDLRTIREEQARGFDSVLATARALGSRLIDGVRIVVVTDGGQPVTPGEAVHPGKATVAGAALCVPQEFPGIGIRTVDLPIDADEPADTLALTHAGHVLAELRWPGSAGAIAYRENRRRVEHLRPVELVAGESSPGPRDHGVYVITGGFGALGLLIARHLAGSVAHPRLVLASRSALPDRTQWDDVVAAPNSKQAKMIQAIRSLEDAGAMVLPYSVDISDPAGVRDLIRTVHATFGPVNGVVHAAGVTEPQLFESIQSITDAAVEAHFAGKVYGTAMLSAALADEPLDFVLLQSSMSAFLGGLGFAAYAAANAFQERFVSASVLGSAIRWRAACWDTWESTVDAVHTDGVGESLARYTISADQGLEVLDRLLRSDHRRVVVSAGDLLERRRQWVPGADPLATFGTATHSGAAQISAGSTTPTRQDYERRLMPLWCAALGVQTVGVTDSLFDLGGNSLIGMQLVGSISREFGRQVPGLALFEAPSITAMADYLLGSEAPSQATPARETQPANFAADTSTERAREIADSDIAIIGMAGRWPGAATVEEFWDNIRGGVESIRFFTDEELIEAGVPRHELMKPNYVKARPVLDNVGDFDAEFFGYTPFEATLADPQQRLFLEVVWEALENAGYAPRSTKQKVGVFAGSNISTYLLRNLSRDPDIAESANDYQAVISNDKDSLTLCASYKLNLRGPSVSVQTFCSTGLVAVHLAYRSILAGDCDMAVAGGVSVRVPDQAGHLFEPGGMESPDGHVRTFDAQARGSIFGDGAGVVVLKRLRDAVADGDSVVAVIKGSAINNDGAMKVGFTAPSITGQSAVITSALADAGVEPATIGYVEAHGTATELGDPIEMAALTRAFGTGFARQSCLIGSVKTNVGHLDRAAGSTGLIKVALSLRDRQIAPSLHFTEPNPKIDFEGGPFRVCTELTEWTAPDGFPRRAGINSLGMGGTNAHMVLQEPPAIAVAPTAAVDPAGAQVIAVSARTADALDAATTDLCKHLAGHPEQRLVDVAHTLQVGRQRFEHRRAVVAGSAAEAIDRLSGASQGQLIESIERGTDTPVTMVLAPCAGLRPATVAALRAGNDAFAATFAECDDALRGLGGPDLAAWLAGQQSSSQVGHDVSAAVDFAVQLGVYRQLAHWGVTVHDVLAVGRAALGRACFTDGLAVDRALRQMLSGATAPSWADESEVVQRVGDPVDRILLVIGGSTDLLDAMGAPAQPRIVSLLTAERREVGWDENNGGQTGWGGNGWDAGEQDAPLHRLVAQLWAAGAEIDWPRMRSVPARRIPLPTYPFQRQRYWVDAPPDVPAMAVGDPDTIRRNPIRALLSIPVRAEQDWFSVPTWKQLAPRGTPTVAQGSRWLIFADAGDRAAGLATALTARGADVVTVGIGDGFAESGPALLTVQPDQPGDHRALFSTLGARGWVPDRIVHCLSMDPTGTAGRSFLDSLINIATAMAETGLAIGELDIVSLASADPVGNDRIEPMKAMLNGPTRVLPLEHPGLRVRHIDLDPALFEPGGSGPVNWSTVADELTTATSEPVVALRGRRRWAPAHEQIAIGPEPDPGSTLKSRGVYLITGGLGGIGLGVARRLAEEVQARLVLVTRHGLPPAAEWNRIIDDPRSPADLVDRLREVAAITDCGGEVLALSADVTDAQQVDDVLASARRHFGRINGVLHAAGSPGIGLTSMKTRASIEQVLGAKVIGTDVLMAALAEDPPDFLVLFSSIAAVTGGGPGQLDYCAANAYLGARAAIAHADGCPFPVVAVDWSEWQVNGWQDATNGMGEEIAGFLAVNRARIGIDFDQGWRSLLRAVALGQPQVTVSTQDPAALIGVAAALDVTTISGQRATVGPRHPRPDLPEPYVAATTALSKTIAELWMDALGLNDIGVNDNFFDLGGNSLLGVDLITRIRRCLDLATLPPHVLYEAPTVADLAAYLGADGQPDADLDASSSRGARRRHNVRGSRS